MESAITSKGQATIPKAVREHLGLKPGDRLRFFLRPEGGAVLLPVLPASALRGMIQAKAPGGRPVTLSAMRKAIAAGAGPVGPRSRH